MMNGHRISINACFSFLSVLNFKLQWESMIVPQAVWEALPHITLPALKNMKVCYLQQYGHSQCHLLYRLITFPSLHFFKQ